VNTRPAPVVHRSTPLLSGGCNFCDRRDGTVFVVRNAHDGGQVVRFCRACMTSLVGQVR
jgi:hypothetical protein